jgi:hypothetical protein
MAEPQTPPAQPATPKHDDASSAAANIEPKMQPIHEIMERLQRGLSDIRDVDQGLAQTVDNLLRQGADPLRVNQRSFQHEVAYALQDVERSRVGTISMSPEARAEATRLAGSAAGLENDRMLALMRSTPGIEDRAVIRDIRRTAAEIGQQADQSTAPIRSQIDVLENRVRLAQRTAEAGPEPAVQSAGTRSAAPSEPPPQGRQAPGERADDSAREQAQQARTGGQQQLFRPGALDVVLRGMRPGDQGNGAPWDPKPTPLGQRLSAFQEKMLAGRDEIAIRDVEKSGRVALDALEGFRTGEGAVVMNRIQQAARSEPGGMAGVLVEMRDGGRFSDLRQQFNNALADEKGVTQAYDKAASALARYGQDRVGIEQVIARRPDAANLSAKFEQMDAQIGEAAAGTPSRRDGKSMVEDLAKQAAELIQRAVDAVKSVFNHPPSAEAGSRAAPSPSMGP